MKKIIILGIALSFGLSSCGYFDFVPVPIEPKDYVYIQAKTAKGGDLLCVGGPFTGPYNDALKDQLNWAAWNSGKVIEIPTNFVGTKTVWIESTLNNWTLKDMNFFGSTSDAPVFYLPPQELGKFFPTGADYPTELQIFNYSVNNWLKLEWPGRTIDIWDYYSIEMPMFSGAINITKTVAVGPTTDFWVIIHVKGYGAFSLDYFPTPAYTSFVIYFKAPVV